jgi:ABC-type multidrug transport system ATPase subunit
MMIEARGLGKHYGATAAVDDLTFTIRPGMVTGFLGPNGAGKTTTMRLILGLDHPSAGSVTVNDRLYAQLSAPMHQVGALLDAGAVHGGRTAREVLSLIAQGRSNAAIAGTLFISPKVVEKHVASIFDKLGLPPSDTDNRRVIAAIGYLES